MPRPLLALVPVTLVALAACASGPAPLAAPPRTAADAPRDAHATPRDFASATEFVEHLARLAQADDRVALDAAIDADFADRLPSGSTLQSLFRSPPDGCGVTLSEGPGYSSIAIAPPMIDDTDEDAARIEALIDELRAATEVDATCEPVGGDAVGALMLYTIAVRRGPEGWRALAWRDHRDEWGSHGAPKLRGAGPS